MAEQFDEFLEEVQNDIRQERWMKLWEKYGKTITTAITCAIGLAAGYTVWQNYEKNQREKTADRFIHALDLTMAGQKQQALLDFSALSRDGKADYALLSRFHQAALLVQEKIDTKQQQALEIYEAIQLDKKNSSQWRDLALLFSLIVKADNAFDKTENTTLLSSIIENLKPLKDEKNPWYYPALELEGLILFKQGKIQDAATVFLTAAKDNKAPKGLSMRAQLMTQVLAEQGVSPSLEPSDPLPS